MRKIVKLLVDMTTFICLSSSKVAKASKDNVILDGGLVKKLANVKLIGGKPSQRLIMS
jgi:hypothetical protein